MVSKPSRPALLGETRQSKKNEFDDHIFAPNTETSGKITTELEHEDELEENSMTVYVKTISGKTISIKCDKKQKEDTVSKKVDMKTSIFQHITFLVHQGKVLNDKKTVEENNIWSRSYDRNVSEIVGGMEENDRRKQMKRWTNFCRQSAIQSDHSFKEWTQPLRK